MADRKRDVWSESWFDSISASEQSKAARSNGFASDSNF